MELMAIRNISKVVSQFVFLSSVCMSSVICETVQDFVEIFSLEIMFTLSIIDRKRFDILFFVTF